MLATPLRMNLNAVHRLRLVSVHVNRFFLVEIVASRIVDEKFWMSFLTLHNSINIYLQMWRNDLRPLLCAWSTKLVMRGGCEWELGYGITYVPTYIALIFPLPRGHECRPFGSRYYHCRSVRKQLSCRSCESIVVYVNYSTQYQQGEHISDRTSDSQITYNYIYSLHTITYNYI